MIFNVNLFVFQMLHECYGRKLLPDFCCLEKDDFNGIYVCIFVLNRKLNSSKKLNTSKHLLLIG